MKVKTMRKQKFYRFDKVELCLNAMSLMTVVYYGCYVFGLA